MTEVVVRRVVLAIDSGERTVTVVREAVRVASSFGAEVEGLFVEDEELLRLSEHGFARRIEGAGPPGALTSGQLEAQWRALAGGIRSALEREAESSRVGVRFEVLRGRAREALRARLAAGDVIVVAWGGWSPRAHRTAPVRVLWDDSEAAERALEVGVRLAGAGGRLEVLIAPDGRVEAEQAAHLYEVTRSRVGRVTLRGLRDARASTIREAVTERPGGLLIVPSSSGLAQQLEDRSVAARVPASVVLVR